MAETVVARVQLPDGSVGRFEVPKDMSPSDVEEQALSAYMAQGRTQSLLAPETTEKSTPKVLAQSVGKAVSNIGDIVAGAPENYKRIGQYALGKLQGQDVEAPRGSTPITNALIKHGIFTPQNEPNTPVGNIADFAIQVAPAVARGDIGSIPSFAKALGKNLAAGTVGGSAVELAKSSGIDNPLAQFAIGAGTMAASQAPFALRHTAASVANQATRNVTPEQLKMADALVKESYQPNFTPITGAEALAKVTGASPLTAVQRVVENLPQSSETMASFMAKRPQANEQMVANALRNISPNQPTSATPVSLQQAGQQVVRGAEQGVTKSVEPFYQQGVNQMQNVQAGKVLPVMPTEVTALQRNPVIDDAISHVIKDKYSGATGLPVTSPQVLDAAKKYLDAQYTKFTDPLAGSLDKTKAANAWGGSRELDSYLSSKSPAYAQGSKNYEVAQKTQIQPMKAGPVGQIAEGKVGAETLMPNKPVALYPTDIKRTVDLLRRKDPSAVPDWTRQQLEGIFNETGQNLQNGPNQFGGAKFASTIQGNKQQKANLQTLIQESAGMQAYQGFERVLNNLEAQGTRQGAGSATSFNNQFQRELSEGGPLAAAKLVFKPSEVATKYEEWQLGKNANKLADMLTNPDSIKQLQDLARTKPNTAKERLLVNSLMGGYVAQKPEITEESK
jgi:hypothetical protein